MSKQPALDPAEALFRDLRGAIFRGDGRAAPGALERALNLEALQYEFLGTVTEKRVTSRLDRALRGRGAFRRFRDELADGPGELALFFRFTDDRRRGRAHRWLAESGLRPSVPAAAAPDGPDFDRRPDHC
jgi:hypothetical protein